MEDKPEEKQASIPFFPDHVRTEFYVVLGILVIVAVVGILGQRMPVGLEDPADPMNTPLHVKPEWYFLSLYQLLKYIPKTTGAVLPVLLVVLVLIWPFLDRKPDKSKRVIRWRAIVVAAIIILIIALTIWGEVS